MKVKVPEEEASKVLVNVKEGDDEGHKEGRNQFAFDKILDGLLTLETGAEKLNMKPEELKQKLGEYKASKEADV
jgi:hypothetical protein